MSEQTQAQQFQVVRVYTKDVSFESPKAPNIFLETDIKPQVSLQLNNGANKLADNIFEVTLQLTVTAKNGEDNLYLVEVTQGGVFRIEGFDDNARSMLLGAYCPSTLFPFARQTIADMVMNGGFPQLLLEPINFDALYQQHLREAAAKQQAEQAAQSEQGEGGVH